MTFGKRAGAGIGAVVLVLVVVVSGCGMLDDAAPPIHTPAAPGVSSQDDETGSLGTTPEGETEPPCADGPGITDAPETPEVTVPPAAAEPPEIPEPAATPKPPAASTQASPPGSPASVVRVIDGDTLVVLLGGVEERVRLIGIDAPERGEPGFAESTAFVRAAVAASGGTVYLEADGVRDRDRFGRLRRTVWLPDGRNLNQLLLNEGLAIVWG
ncbi:MAG: thermonuclease family protein [Cellulomonadaceae bacterium]|jgi:micrococcal nuclease|nr:thermonuclease family protein [Cellulomonadaceae bacterium]